MGETFNFGVRLNDSTNITIISQPNNTLQESTSLGYSIRSVLIVGVVSINHMTLTILNNTTASTRPRISTRSAIRVQLDL